MHDTRWRDLCRSLIGKPMPLPVGGDRLPRHVHKTPDVDAPDEPTSTVTATTTSSDDPKGRDHANTR